MTQTTQNSRAASATIRVAYGQVAGVRAISSREVSVISVEIPDEFHVEATSLLHGRDALVVRAEIGKGYRYGVISPGEPAQAESADTTEPAEGGASDTKGPDSPKVFGRVTMVRPIPSRQVTAIYVEIPDVFHVDVTNLLHGRDALVMPAALPAHTPYGVFSGAPSAGGASRPAPAASPRATVGQSISPLLQRRGDGIIVTKWLGARCAEDAFQQFLKVRNEAQARDKVCELCGVTSRAEIQASPQAMLLFRDLIFRPFELYQAAQSRLTAEGANS